MKIRLAALFCDHAVLQHGKPIPVWGWTEPDTVVQAELAGQRAETCAGADGTFMLRLPPLAPGGPHDLTVKAGRSRTKAKDLMVGEVWVASGQSNMEWSVASCGKQGEATLKNSSSSSVRMFKVNCSARFGRQSDVTGSWQIAGPATLGQFSAVGFHFAEMLQKKLKVPVGIISSNWGGTIIEAWTSRESLIENPDTRAWTERYEACVHQPGHAVVDAAAHRAQNFPADPGTKAPAKWAGATCDDSAWEDMALPCLWQEDGHDFSGVFWFRLSIDVPAAWAGKKLKLDLGAIDKMDVTYFNGKRVGATGKGLEEDHWNIPRCYTVPGRLVKKGRNFIAVRAFSFVHGGGLIGPAEAMTIAPADGSGKAISLAGSWRYAVEHNLGKTTLPGSQALPMGPQNPNSPYILHDNMIHPLIPYAIGGVIWYQGESNCDNAGQYRDMMIRLIRDWRRAWGQGAFPFLMVQLANCLEKSDYQEASSWARLREAQFQALSEPATGMAVAIDVGDAQDIHPQDKRSVGERLAQWALVRHFGKPGVASGPLYAGMTIEGNRIRIRFEIIGRGLVAKRGKAVSHVVIAGTGRRFVPAKAVIEGGTLVVESPEIEFPVAVRYAWADNPEGCNLYNRDGLPASPFRTDNW